jgi:hypothetical protein
MHVLNTGGINLRFGWEECEYSDCCEYEFDNSTESNYAPIIAKVKLI